MARYKLIDHLRRQRLRITINIDDCNELFSSSGNEAEDASRDVQSLLAELPDGQPIAITLTRLEGLIEEGAEARSGQSPSGIKVSVHRNLNSG